MIVAIHQPNLFPRLKVLQKIALADVWVIHDDVQYAKQEWQNRARVRPLLDIGEAYWVTAPIRKAKHTTQIRDIRLHAPRASLMKISHQIASSYRASCFWPWIRECVEKTLKCNSDLLEDLCVASTLSCLAMLGIHKQHVRSSQLMLKSNKTMKLIDICHALRAVSYIAGSGSRCYMDTAVFQSSGIRLQWQDWRPEFAGLTQQCWRDVSYLDLAARLGPKVLRDHLLGLPVSAPPLASEASSAVVPKHMQKWPSDYETI